MASCWYGKVRCSSERILMSRAIPMHISQNASACPERSFIVVHRLSRMCRGSVKRSARAVLDKERMIIARSSWTGGSVNPRGLVVSMLVDTLIE
jgi:hypothetical protein